jgi:hypothetical protein
VRRIDSIFAFVLMILLFCTSTVFAEVQTRVRIIGASNVGSSIDPSLRDVHDQLGTLFNFTSYRLLRDLNLHLVGNQPAEVPVHKGRSMEVTLIGEYRNTVELRIRIKRDGMNILDTQVRLSQGRTILIGGPKHGEGEIILAISARF